MAALRGYKLLPGPSRRYRTPGGRTISRREYDNRQARAAGWRNRYELEQFRSSVGGSRWLSDIYQHTGRAPTWDTYHDLREVKTRRARIEAGRERRGLPFALHGETDREDPDLVAADGPLARLLDASGKRPISGRDVGDS
jgi:hypothetical protein